MREIGLNPRTGGGKRGDAARLDVQMERLFRATVTFEDARENHKAYVDMQVTSQGVLGLAEAGKSEAGFHCRRRGPDGAKREKRSRGKTEEVYTLAPV
ncbi:hypothetical protein [Edaphobacter aggregans]|uniref:hypothetical protein n=1 Tax=Edaphobacter aggregans TaxID=570835 RepID=UPI001B80DE72|nr:hypothetical protein [Edaphobacter aggregans]